MRLMWKPRGYSPVASSPRGRGSRCRRAAAPMAFSNPGCLARPSDEYFAQRAGISSVRFLWLVAASRTVPVAEHGALEVEAPPSDRRKASAQSGWLARWTKAQPARLFRASVSPSTHDLRVGVQKQPQARSDKRLVVSDQGANQNATGLHA